MYKGRQVIQRLRLGESDRDVDPRVRGEAMHAGITKMGAAGRSPRARGSHVSYPRHSYDFGSIPACVGKPDGARLRPRP